MTTALSGNEARGQAAGLLGKPVGSGAFLLARWSPFLVATAAHLLSLAAVLLIRKPFQDEQARPAERRRIGPEIAEGLRWLWRRRFLRRITLLVSGSNVIFQALALLPAFVLYEDGFSPAAVGVIAAIGGAGGACGALAGGWSTRRFGLPVLVCAALVAWAVMVPTLALTRSPWALGALSAAMSLVGGALNVAGGVYQVRITPDALQGRVNSVLQLAGSGANAVGALAGGLLLDALGASGSAGLLGAAMGVLALTALASNLPRQYRLAHPPDEAAEGRTNDRAMRSGPVTRPTTTTAPEGDKE
nr:MFS transporter [Streptomyces sp. GQFP]